MNFFETLFARLLFAPSAMPYGRSAETAGWELDGSNWSPMNVGDWLAANEAAAHVPSRHTSNH